MRPVVVNPNQSRPQSAGANLPVTGILCGRFLGVFFGCWLSASCLPQPGARDMRHSSIPWTGQTQAVSATTTASGTTKATIQPNNQVIQVVSVDGATPVSGTSLAFPPGALSIQTEVQVEEGAPLAVPSFQAAVGLFDNVARSGTPVAVSSSAKVDPVLPFTIALNIPGSAALLDSGVSYAVAYKIIRHVDGSFLDGVIPSGGLVIKENKVVFEAAYFGVYQVVVTKTPVVEAKAVPAVSPVRTKAAVAALPPVQISARTPFVVRAGQTVELRGKNFRPTMQIAMGGTPVRGLNVASDVSASFVAPNLGSFGLTNLNIDQDGTSQTISLAYRGDGQDLPVITMAPADVCLGQRYYDMNGQIQTGTKACYPKPPAEACTRDGQVNCLAVSPFKAADMRNFTAANVQSGTTIAGVPGSLANCSADGGTGCVAVTAFKAVDMTKLTEGVIKNGTAIASVVGNYGPTCTADGAQDCMVSSGSTFKAANVSGITSWDIRAGKTLAAIGGSLLFYKNMANTIAFNRTSGTGGSAGADIYDTIDDYNNNAESPFIPTTNPWGGVTVAPGSNWTTVTPPCDGSGACVLRDETTGLLWAKGDDTKRPWEFAINYCAGLNYGGYSSGWRLPSQKELMQAYVDGIWTNKTKLALQKIDSYWSSTTVSDTPGNAIYVLPSYGGSGYFGKAFALYVLCVR